MISSYNYFHAGQATRKGDENSLSVYNVRYEPQELTVESAELRLNTFVLTSMRIPNRLRGLYRLHLSAHSSFTIITKLMTIRSDGRDGALLVTNP
ncbi:unnamed protein product [Blumeria hordei]|uniref:Uncharacterized protein n=1 Tax=Blumeria hordei TaxID=2867405 RepID=A0A383UY84_BLUHO|nr:unnamed protein product [Blumeria hordei]